MELDAVAEIDATPTSKGLMIPWRNLLGAIALIVIISGAYFQNRSSVSEIQGTMSRVNVESSDRFTRIETALSSAPDHERRIAALEAQKTDRLAAVVEQQSKQIDIIAQALSKEAAEQQADHDVLLRLATLMEAQSKR